MSVHEFILGRHSPYRFLDKPIPAQSLQTLWEAAGRAASAYNEQPWRFIYATREDPQAYKAILGCLVEANQSWAEQAPLLILSFAKRRYSKNGKPNDHAQHDLGLAVGNLTVQASFLGLKLHSMAGIEPDKIRAVFGVPETYDVVTAIAVGYSDEAHSGKPRKAVEEIAAMGRWNFS